MRAVISESADPELLGPSPARRKANCLPSEPGPRARRTGSACSGGGRGWGRPVSTWPSVAGRTGERPSSATSPQASALAAAAPQRQRRGHTGLRAGLADPAQLARDVVGALPAVVRVLLQALPHDVVERRRRHRLDRRDGRRLRRHDRRDQARLRLALERAAAPSPSRRGAPPARRCRCARRPPAPRAAPAPCTGTCRGSFPPLRERLRLGGKRRSSPRPAPSPGPERARPKSRSFAPVFVSITLPGLRSRWTMPCLCARSGRPRPARRSGRPGRAAAGPSGSRSASDSPSSSSITRKCASPSCPTSNSVQMWGWLSEEIVFASRSKRWRRSSSCAKPTGRILTATLAVETVSFPRQTSPMPPAPIGA